MGGQARERCNAYLFCRSILEPTITQGMEFIPQKLIILSYTTWTMSKDLWFVTEYTRT